MERKGDTTAGMKSAYEAALERLERQGIERPRDEALSREVREAMAGIRRKAEAQLAELEILHRDQGRKATDPEALRQAEEEYRIDRRRIEERRDREIEKLRTGS
jgi:hypothetical protein